MVWQEAFPPTGGPAFDAEAERERRLAAQARAGADWALTALIARYQPTVVRYLTRLCGNQAQARRLAERIFQRMERRLHGPHGGENLRLWLLRSCTEAGLDALRRPRSRSTPRLAGATVAGLLTEQSGADSQSLFGGGLRRLRRAGGVSRQARPLIWANDPAAANASAASGEPTPAPSESHLDETLDHLDPADALRHRLVRVTLAELPYGDAQCLALHLVAGLNQAEVAKALGITNSAARKRIVHGLALFSDRYGQAVQSLGLPVELGFGDALPRAPEPIAEPAPAPVVVSSKAPDASDPAERVDGEDRLIAVTPSPDQGRDVLSGVAYLSEDSGETEAISPDNAPEPYPDYSGYPNYPDAPLTHASAARRPTHPPVAVALGDALDAVDQTLIATQDPAPVSGGLITRVASDAILGPIVDALPVTDSPEASGSFGLPALRSMPLALELSSHQAPTAAEQSEPASIRMNWLDDSGLMTPLSFEAVAVSTPVAEPTLAEDAPLTFEAAAAGLDASLAPQDDGAPAEDTPLAYELAQAEADERAATPTEAAEIGAASEGRTGDEPLQTADNEPLALVAEPTPPPPVMVPVLTLSGEPAAPDAQSAPGDAGEPDAPLFTPRSASFMRSLEDIWDELPDSADI